MRCWSYALGVAVAIGMTLAVAMPAADEVSESALIAEEKGWQAEVVMPDGSRCDLLSEHYAVEVEWATKWKEAPAQAVLYAIWTDRKPLVILISRNMRDDKVEILRCKLVCERLGVAMQVRPAVN